MAAKLKQEEKFLSVEFVEYNIQEEIVGNQLKKINYFKGPLETMGLFFTNRDKKIIP